MTESFSRNQVASSSVALVVCVLLLFLLGGCAATPKTAATRFDSFAQVTTTLGTQVVGAYVLDDTIAQKARVLQFTNEYSTHSSVFLQAPTDLPAQAIHARQILMLGLIAYANALKDILNDEPLNTFSEKAATVGKEVDGIKSTLKSLVPTPTPAVSGEDLGKAVGELGKTLMDLKRLRYIKAEIKTMSPQIKNIIDFLKGDLGSCHTALHEGITHYCLSQTGNSGKIAATELTPASGLGEYYCQNFSSCDKQYRRKIKNLNAKPVSAVKNISLASGTVPPLSGDQLKIAEQLALLPGKAKSACEGLDLLKKSLDEYYAIHKKLETALDGKSSALATELNTLLTQLSMVKQYFDSALAN